jgi:hypothetical protein
LPYCYTLNLYDPRLLSSNRVITQTLRMLRFQMHHQQQPLPVQICTELQFWMPVNRSRLGWNPLPAGEPTTLFAEVMPSTIYPLLHDSVNFNVNCFLTVRFFTLMLFRVLNYNYFTQSQSMHLYGMIFRPAALFRYWQHVPIQCVYFGIVGRYQLN